MKLTMSTVVAIALCSAGMAAQSTPMKEDHMGKPAKNAEQTVTGCVALGDGLGRYLLTDVAAAGDAMKRGEMRMDEMAPRSYALLGGKLEPHVGHRVEVTGRREEKAPTDTMPGHDAMASGSMSHEPGMAMPPATLRITSIRKVAGSCS
jgi:hypothetical protein